MGLCVKDFNHINYYVYIYIYIYIYIYQMYIKEGNRI